MTTGYIPLPPAAWYPTDDSAGSASAQLQKRTSSDATDPQTFWLEWLFDDTTQEHIQTSFVMPGNYASAPVLKVYYKMTSATADEVIFGGVLAAVTDADATDVDANEMAAENLSAATTVPGTAGYMDVASITLTNADSVAAGDHVILCLYRDADNAGDDATGDAENINAELQYTTT